MYEKQRKVACAMLYVAFGFAPEPSQVMIERCDHNSFGEVKALVFRVSPCARKYEYCFNSLHVHLRDGVQMRLPIGGFNCNLND